MAGTRWPALRRAGITVIGGGGLWDMSKECEGSGIHLVMFECGRKVVQFAGAQANGW